MCFLEKMNGLCHGAITFDAVRASGLGGDDLGVFLRGGAGEIDFGENLFWEIGCAKRDEVRQNKDEYRYNVFHNFRKSRHGAKAAAETGLSAFPGASRAKRNFSKDFPCEEARGILSNACSPP